MTKTEITIVKTRVDSNDIIKKKINRAITDSGSKIKYSKDKPGLSNLIDIYSCLSREEVKTIEQKYRGKMYSHFKNDLIEIIITCLDPIREKYDKIINDSSVFTSLMRHSSVVAPSVVNPEGA